MAGRSKSFAKSNYHAMAKNTNYATHKFLDFSVEFHKLIIEKFHNGLADGQSNCFHK